MCEVRMDNWLFCRRVEAVRASPLLDHAASHDGERDDHDKEQVRRKGKGDKELSLKRETRWMRNEEKADCCRTECCKGVKREIGDVKSRPDDSVL